MSYREFDPNVLSFYDGIYVFLNFCLWVFSTLDVLHSFQVRLFAFTWRYFDLVKISFNAMYYFHQRISCLNHCDCIVIVDRDGYGNKAYFECAVTSTLLTVNIRYVQGNIRCDLV